MKQYWQIFISIVLVAFLSFTTISSAYSQVATSWESDVGETPKIAQAETSTDNESESPTNIQQQPITSEKSPKGAPVILDGTTLFTYRFEIRGIPAEERAQRTIEQIEKVARDFSLPVDSLEVVNLEGLSLISTKDQLIMVLIEADAKAVNQPVEELANELLKNLKAAISQYRQKRSLRVLIVRLIYTFIATIVVVILFSFLNKIVSTIKRHINGWRETQIRPVRIQNFQILSPDQQINLISGIIKLIRWAVILVVLYIYIPLVLSFFPQTEKLAKKVFSSIYILIGAFWSAFLEYLPNLFIIILTIFTTYYIIRFCKLLFNALDRRIISLPGFYQEWANPTYKLTVILIVGLAVTIIFPYLPGFGSPAFRGISILLGALVTLGGATTIANLIGGFVVIYTRAFQIGDRIKIDNFIGIVIEKTILSTRIRNDNNEIITIPNSSMIAGSIVNYTATFRDLKTPLILSTTITLGYDVPWRKVHQVLIEAASATSDILQEPTPFVWQTSLNDFYVSYELKAFTNNSLEVGEIYSQLHQNIQDKCHEAEIEIMSPHYSAIRDGHQTTIPDDYLPKDYTTPGFRFHPLQQIFNSTQNPSNNQAASDDEK